MALIIIVNGDSYVLQGGAPEIAFSCRTSVAKFYGLWYNVGPPSDVNVGLDSPHEYYSYLRTINHSEIGVMFTN